MLPFPRPSWNRMERRSMIYTWHGSRECATPRRAHREDGRGRLAHGATTPSRCLRADDHTNARQGQVLRGPEAAAEDVRAQDPKWSGYRDPQRHKQGQENQIAPRPASSVHKHLHKPLTPEPHHNARDSTKEQSRRETLPRTGGSLPTIHDILLEGLYEQSTIPPAIFEPSSILGVSSWWKKR